jgi:hypothetical protein
MRDRTSAASQRCRRADAFLGVNAMQADDVPAVIGVHQRQRVAISHIHGQIELRLPL